MTALSPDQGTGPTQFQPVTIVLESLARHRRDAAAAVATPPGWFLIALTLTAVAAGITGMLIRSLAVLLLALAYAVIALAADIVAAVQARRSSSEADA